MWTLTPILNTDYNKTKSFAEEDSVFQTQSAADPEHHFPHMWRPLKKGTYIVCEIMDFEINMDSHIIF